MSPPPNLGAKAVLGTAAFLPFLGALIFLPAGTLDYWQAWAFLAVYAVCTLGTVAYFLKNDPALLERRMRGGPFAETAPAQKIIMSIFSVGFFAVPIVCGFDHRLQWSHEAGAVAILGDVLMAFGFYAVTVVLRENSFAAATIQVAHDQKVITSGPYALVRHPMYAGGVVLLLGIPLALGSYWGLTPFAAVLPVLIWRLLDEEAFLCENLTGYKEYAHRVRWRLVPGLF